MFKKIFDLNKLSTLLLYTSILTFIISFNFAHNPPNGWQQQFMPNLNNRPLSDVQFIDSLVGYGITGDHTGGDTNYVIKTTNGGDNWFIINSVYIDLSKVKFINSYTGFVCGGPNGTGGFLTKTTNGGMNWFVLNTPFGGYFDDIFVLSEDTIWLTADVGLIGGLFRTTDGGSSWIRQFYANGNIPAKIYMINSQTGFFSTSGGSFLNKTTDGGFNWTVITGEIGFLDIDFSDTLNGWKSYTELKKTTNGGLNWTVQMLPTGGINGGYISYDGISSISKINSDTIWCDGGHAYYGGGSIERGALFRTTNNGNNWLFQIPDTSYRNEGYGFLQFIDNSKGWALGKNFIHTLSGGDSTFFTSIKETVVSQPDNFILKQNYPNPFNPVTTIEYEITSKGFINLSVYNIQGKKQTELVNKIQNTGNYKVNLNGSDLPSGIYFYTMFVNGNRIQTKKMMLLK